MVFWGIVHFNKKGVVPESPLGKDDMFDLENLQWPVFEFKLPGRLELRVGANKDF